MTANQNNDWDPGTYAKFRGFRLRPALDLLAQVPELPPGDVVDLGCGNGMPATDLRLRFAPPGRRRLVGVDTSPVMLEEAAGLSLYDDMIKADAAHWLPQAPVAMIFSNALLHWLPDHDRLMPRLAGLLAPGGVFAVQMPRQFAAPSHALLRQTAEALFPDRFDYSAYVAPVASATHYARMLDRFGTVSALETEYSQRLDPVQNGHPVRHFTQSTAMRPMLEKLDDNEQAAFIASYDNALMTAYPLGPDGSALMPFRRVFFILTCFE